MTQHCEKANLYKAHDKKRKFAFLTTLASYYIVIVESRENIMFAGRLQVWPEGFPHKILLGVTIYYQAHAYMHYRWIS